MKRPTLYFAFRGDYINPTPPGLLDTDDIPIYLAAEVDEILDDMKMELEAKYDNLA